MTSKYIEKIFENRWEVIGTDRDPEPGKYTYVIRNIYNDEEMKLCASNFYSMVTGKTSVNSLRKHAFKTNQGYKRYHANKLT